MMALESYADILKFAIQMQIKDIENDEAERSFATEYSEGYYSGMKRGLEIALQKIDASKFIWDK